MNDHEFLEWVRGEYGNNIAEKLLENMKKGKVNLPNRELLRLLNRIIYQEQSLPIGRTALNSHAIRGRFLGHPI
ncbi:MAG: hypothetical protein Q7R64_01325 [bacterium]|nr:hypothetical protein [bacterium]